MSQIKVHYPSGNILNFEGAFVLADIDSEFRCQPAVDAGDKKLILLDPRGVVYADDKRVYGPRDHIETMRADMSEWLSENKSWDNRQ